MGVPGFFAWLIKKYQKNRFLIFEINKPEILYIDSNCLFHPMCFEVLKYYEQNYKFIDLETLEQKMFNRIIKYIKFIIDYVNPKTVYISVDGVAPMAKINQQRKRRFKSAIDNSKINKIKEKYLISSNQWSNTVITPGTEFMEKLHEKILHFINNKYKKYELIYSSYHEAGEGEHKIHQHILLNKPESCVIYGLDSDLFFLALASSQKNIFLIREYSELTNENKQEEIDLETVDRSLAYVSIDDVRECYNHTISNMIYYKNKNMKIENIDFTKDFIILCMFLGNDFLPHSPVFDIKRGNIDTMIDIYTDVFIKYRKNIYYKEQIRTDILIKILKIMADIEHDFALNINIYRKKNYYLKDYEKKIYDHENLLDIESEENIINYNNSDWHYKYYEHFFNVETYYLETVEEVSENYINTIKWNIEYYFNKCPDWHWQYKYTHSPFIGDIYNYLIKNKVDMNRIEFNINRPLEPMTQLLCVLHPDDNKLLPKSYKKLVSEKSDIIDMFPVYAHKDSINKMYNWQCVLLLNCVDIVRIYKVIEKCKLTKQEEKRNILIY